jgi:hypothetical protein
MPTRDVWTAEVSNILKSELKRKGLNYADLTQRLARIGVKDEVANVRNKVSRGRFTAVFFLQCLRALESDRLRTD